MLLAAIGAQGGSLGRLRPQAGLDLRLARAGLPGAGGDVRLVARSPSGSSTGEIAVDLARPLDLQLSWWARDLGRAASQLPTRGLAPLLIGALTIGVALPGSWTAYPLGLVSLLLAVSISFLCRYVINLIAFWTVDVQGFLNLYILVLGLLSGFFVPVHVFPGLAARPSPSPRPFPSMFQSPDRRHVRPRGRAAAWQVIAGQAAGWSAWWSSPGSCSGERPGAGGAGWLTGLSLRRAYADPGRIAGPQPAGVPVELLVTALTSFAIGVLEFTEIYVLLATVPTLRRADLIQAALVFALANIGVRARRPGLRPARPITGYLRMGKLEVLLVRPMPLMAQLVTADFQLRRPVGWRSALLVVVVALVQADLVLDARTGLPAGHHAVRRAPPSTARCSPGRRACSSS